MVMVDKNFMHCIHIVMFFRLKLEDGQKVLGLSGYKDFRKEMFQFGFFLLFCYLLGRSIPQHPWNSLSSGFFKLLRVANHQKLYGKVASTLQKKML